MPFPIDSIIDYVMQASMNSGGGSAHTQDPGTVTGNPFAGGYPTQAGNIAIPKSQEEFDALPNGTWYVEPDDGHIYQKGNKRKPVSQPPRGVLT